MAIEHDKIHSQTVARRGVADQRSTGFTNFIFQNFSGAETSLSDMAQEALEDAASAESVAGVSVPLEDITVRKIAHDRGLTVLRYGNRRRVGSSQNGLKIEMETGRVGVEWLRLAFDEVTEPRSAVAAFESIAWSDGEPGGSDLEGNPHMNRVRTPTGLVPRQYVRQVDVWIVTFDTLLDDHPFQTISPYIAHRVNANTVTFGLDDDVVTIPQYQGYFDGAVIRESGDKWATRYRFYLRADPWVRQVFSGDLDNPIAYEAMSDIASYTDPGFPA